MTRLTEAGIKKVLAAALDDLGHRMIAGNEALKSLPKFCVKIHGICAGIGNMIRYHEDADSLLELLSSTLKELYGHRSDPFRQFGFSFYHDIEDYSWRGERCLEIAEYLRSGKIPDPPPHKDQYVPSSSTTA